MPALESLRGIRVVADGSAIDAARWDGDGAAVVILRFAPDEAFGLDARAVDIADQHAIVVEETGLAGVWLSAEALGAHVFPRVEWPIPTERPALAQGLVAGVSCKLWLSAAGGGLLLTAAAWAVELEDRLT
ncbi:MAG TPA: hypothetical protein VM344_01200 [Vitreimonas sp.]|nr:hypothetical protein [Vitreimonas sp.]